MKRASSGYEAHRTLCSLGVKNIVINPADVPTSGKEREYKSDSADSRKLARELENGSLEGIYIPKPENLELRNLTRRETKLMRKSNSAVTARKSSCIIC